MLPWSMMPTETPGMPDKRLISLIWEERPANSALDALMLQDSLFAKTFVICCGSSVSSG